MRRREHDEPIEPRPITVRSERAASLLGISPRMLEELQRVGAIPSYKIAGRVRLYRVRDLEDWAAGLSETLSAASPPRDDTRLEIGGPGAQT